MITTHWINQSINQCIKTKHCNIIIIISHWHRLVIAYRIVLKSRFARSCKNWDFSCVCKKSQKSQGWQFFERQLRKLRKIKVWWFLALVGIFRSSLSCWCSLFSCSWSLKSKASCQFYQSCNKSDNFLLYLPFWHLPVSVFTQKLMQLELDPWGSIVLQVSCYTLLFKLGIFEQGTKYH